MLGPSHAPRGTPVADLDYLAAQAAARPDEAAVFDGDWVITRADFNAMVNRYGHVLRSATFGERCTMSCGARFDTSPITLPRKNWYRARWW